METKTNTKKKTLILFDVDGTLTEPRKYIHEKMINTLKNITFIENVDIGFVGGSDLHKQIEQLGEENMSLFTWKFSENGLMAYHNDEIIHKKSIIDELGEDKYQILMNVFLSVLSETYIPKKRGGFIELRNGMINISPIGRSCSQVERDEFDEWDKIHKCREQMIQKISTNSDVKNMNLTFSIGGQISMDVFPKGWDKTYCLQFVEKTYDTIYFFGDKTYLGGNDYEIYIDKRVNAYSVNNFNETIQILENIFNLSSV